jgi:NtrC-family two-component system sensor histidine kinase KinB
VNHIAINRARNRVHRLVRHGILAISLIGSVSILLCTIFSLFLSQVISKPVAELKEAVSQIAHGNYEVQVPVRGNDELALLASQFNLMAEKLRQYHAMNVSQIISEKQKGEAIIQSVDDGLIVADGNLLISDINPKAASIFGVKRDEVLGRHILEVVRDENLLKSLRQSIALKGETKVTEREDILTVMSEGRQLHMQLSIIPINTPDQVIPGVMLLLHDVTRLHELDRLKSEFVLTASHELRTPLTGIGMAINMLLEKALPKLTDEEHNLLKACYGEVRRLSTLVKDLLDLSKIEAGKLEMAFESVAPSFLCDQAFASVKNQAEAKHIEFTMEVPGNLPPVQADPAKIVWVLINLLANAVRHSPEGSRIDLKGERAGSQIHFSVRDDGEGVPYEDQSRIFDKFVQVSRKDNSEGTGLGLAICREIVRAHQGTIWLDSHPGEGSTFTFTLPLAQA